MSEGDSKEQGGFGHSEALRSVQSASMKGIAGVTTYHQRNLMDKPVGADPPSSLAQVSSSIPRKATSPARTTGEESTLDNEADAFLSRITGNVRPVPLLDDERGIIRVRSLMERRAYADVTRITLELLQTATSPYASFYSDLINMDIQKEKQQNVTIERLEQETAEIISMRIIALLKLKRYNDLGREVDRLNLLDEHTLPWVPFGLQILAAHTLQYTEAKSDKCVDKLHRMKHSLTDKNQCWLSTLNNTLSNVYIAQKEYRLALSSLSDLILSMPNTVSFILKEFINHYTLYHQITFNNDQFHHLTSLLLYSCRIEILSRQARILLQVGSIPEAQYVFTTIQNYELVKLNSSLDHASTVLDTPVHSDFFNLLKQQSIIIQQAPIQVILNNGLLLFAKEDYNNAMDTFTLAINKQRTLSNPDTKTFNIFQQSVLSPGLGLNVETTLITSCLNNVALCALYTCQMNQAVDYMERLICENPTLYLTEGLAFNLCTLYELGSENTVSSRKKHLLQHIAKRFFLHDITPEYFRIV